MITQYSNTQLRNTQLRNTQYRDLLPTVFSLGKPYFWSMASQVEKDVSNYVSKMIDISGNGNHPIQGTQINKPLWVDDELNGYPVLRFNESNWLKCQYPTTINQPITIFALWRKSNAGNYACFCNYSSSYFDLQSNGTGVQIHAGVTLGYTKTSPFDFILSSSIFNSTASKIFENGALLMSGNVGSGIMNGITIGALCNNTWKLNGDIAEIIIYNKLLSNIDRKNVETYLMNKYGL